MARQTKERADDLVPHPFPAKGTRKQVKRSYREYLIEQAKEKGDKRKPAPISEPALEPDIAVTAAPGTETPNGPFKEDNGKPPQKPPRNWKEIRLVVGDKADDKVRIALAKKKERGETRIQWRYYSCGYHVYWAHKSLLN